MKYLKLIPILAPLVFAACAPLGPPRDVETTSDAQTPAVTLTPVSEPPVADKVKSNSGRGNGSEGNPDRDPGNSGGRNNGGD